jgi:hypothetical protein
LFEDQVRRRFWAQHTLESCRRTQEIHCRSNSTYPTKNLTHARKQDEGRCKKAEVHLWPQSLDVPVGLARLNVRPSNFIDTVDNFQIKGVQGSFERVHGGLRPCLEPFSTVGGDSFALSTAIALRFSLWPVLASAAVTLAIFLSPLGQIITAKMWVDKWAASNGTPKL